jgi:hypothetical protein
MTCSVLTQERVDQLLGRTLEEPARVELQKHFEQPCEACLDRLASVDGEALLLALAGPQAELTVAEKNRVFARASAHAPVAASPPWLERLRGFFAPPRLLAFAGVAIALAVAVPLLRPTVRPWDGSKGSALPQTVGLRGFAGSGDAALRPIEPDGTVHPGEQLFLRFTLPKGGHLYLYSQPAEGPAQLLWKPEANDTPWPAGEHELQQNGVALAVPLAQSTRLWAVVASTPRAALEQLSRFDEATVRTVCAECDLGQVGFELR